MSPSNDAIPPSQKGRSQGIKRTAPQAPLLDVDELGAWLGVEPGFVRRLIAQRRVPFVKIGKYVRFDPEEIAAWIDGQRVRLETPSRRRTSRD